MKIIKTANKITSELLNKKKLALSRLWDAYMMVMSR